MDDVFYTEFSDDFNQKKLAEIEQQNIENTRINTAFNHEFIKYASMNYEDYYNKGFTEGKNYSLEYGKLLGIIKAIMFYETINEKKLDKEDIIILQKTEEELENYKEKITNDFIKKYKEILEPILYKYTLR